LALSIPPFGWWPLAWIGLAGLASLLPGRPLRDRAALGFGAGLGQYVIGLWWVHEFSIPGDVALMLLSALFVTAAVMAVPTGRRLSIVLGLPAALVLADWLRDRFPLGGFPLGGIALGQAASPLLPVVRVGGALLLTGSAALAGVALSEVVRAAGAWRSAWSRCGPSGPARGAAWRNTLGAVALLAVLAALAVAGALAPAGRDGRLTPIRAVLVQGGGPRGTRAIFTDPEVVFRRQLAASRSLRPPLDLVVWPEGMLQSHVPFTRTADRASVSALAVATGATVLVGVDQDVGDRRYLNEVVAWAPDGTIVGSYVKHHLVPFGEYVPARGLLQHFFNLQDVPFDAIAGHGPGVVDTPAGRLGLMISYEVFFSDRARDAVRDGGQVLVEPTDTASYRSTQVPTQELAAARLRATETGRWLLQVTPTGYTAVVSPDGRVVARTSLDEQRALTAVVPRLTGRTWYVDFGDAPVAGAALVAYLLSLILARSGRVRRDSWTMRALS
jgi:apolipoprotein N-acyltransferase